MFKFLETGPKPPSFKLALWVAVTAPILSLGMPPLLETQAQTTGPNTNATNSPEALVWPQSVAPDTQVWIDGDSSLKPTTQSLSSSFEAQFPGSSVNYESQGSDAAVMGVIAGRLDVAAIGRSLTPLEQQAGVTTLSLPREKIATFVSVENPFRGDISNQQFAQIFRGEITNWSELGGEDVPIRFIDMAADRDTRRSLSTYDIFQTAAFQNGETATTQSNNISSVIENLGSDGLGYAPFEQVKNRSDIRILPMHGVMPTDARYPFSQPRSFAYLGANPSPEAIAFLGYVNNTVPEASSSQADLAAPAAAPDWSLGQNARAGDGNRSEGAAVSSAVFGPALVESAVVADKTLPPSSASADSLPNTTANGNLGDAAASPNGTASEVGNGIDLGDAATSHVVSYRPSIMDTIHAPWWWLLPLAPLGVIGAAALRRKRLNAGEAQDLGASANAPAILGFAGTSLSAGAGQDGAGLGKISLVGAGLTGAGLAATGVKGKGKGRRAEAHPQDRPISSPLQGSPGTIANDDAAGFALNTPHRQTLSEEDFTGAGLAGAGLAGMGLSGAKKQAKQQAQTTANEQGDRPFIPQANPRPSSQPAISSSDPAQSSDQVQSPQPRELHRKFVDHSIDKALERPNGGKKAVPIQGQSGRSPELQYSNPKPGHSLAEPTIPADPTAQPLSSEAAGTVQPPISRSGDLTSSDLTSSDLTSGDSTSDDSAVSGSADSVTSAPAETNTTLGNALKRAGLGAAEIAGTTALTGAAAQEPSAQGPASRLGAPMAGPGNSDNEETWITLTPLNSHQGEVNWHLSPEHRLRAKQQGGRRMMIRIHDADPSTQTEQWPSSRCSYECDSGTDRKQVDLPVADRDYVAELGFLTAEEDWIHVARSIHSHSPTPEYDGCRIVIMPCDPHRQMHSGPTRHPKAQAYVYWDIAPEFKRRLRKQGGQMLVLRIYDADHINLDQQSPHHTDEYVLDENARDKVVAVPTAEHDYVAEIGYLTIAGEFLSLGRSAYVHIPVAASHQ